MSWFRAILLFVSQILGGIAGAALVAALTPFGGVDTVTTTLSAGVNTAQGFFIEAFLTAMLVLSVLFLAAEKHKSTYLAPLGIGLTLLVCHLFGVAWTGCGVNPARSFGPAVVDVSFPGYHWIYWIGPLFGSMMAVAFYLLLKAFDYTSVVFGQDADHELTDAEVKRREDVNTTLFTRAAGKALVVFHAKPGHQGQSEEVKQFDADDLAMAEAIRNGEASLVDPAMAEKGLVEQALSRGSENGYVQGAKEDQRAANGNAGYTEQSIANGAQNGAQAPRAAPSLDMVRNAPGVAAGGVSLQGTPSMRAEAQDVGGLNVPGTHHEGFARSSRARDVLHQHSAATTPAHTPKAS